MSKGSQGRLGAGDVAALDPEQPEIGIERLAVPGPQQRGVDQRPGGVQLPP
ncbi:hypothetical protein F4553_002193 [Allocatelliglobosispora scoriae]|uniref:Uncharacterized protein n=1 Tax=Allocatelliglobosispora scoriae TaxID=643052 RepID=A0A841BKK8_9ACTN|nr:hypothetical protein [Allocatelliglobosispora scoriae]MBB5868814.1 hypothetical protein [Allocatelliglobosispora scoriae]